MMQQQIRTQTPKKNKPAASLIISWLIILGVYLLLRLVFVIFGFHLAPVVLGGCLAVLPYIAGAFYLFKTPAAHRVGGCVLGILLPSIVEKLVLYFLGASLYGIPLAFSDDGLIHGYMGALTRGHFHTTGIRLCRPALTESAEKRHQFYCVYELR